MATKLPDVYGSQPVTGSYGVGMNPDNMKKMADAQVQQTQKSSIENNMPAIDPNGINQLGSLGTPSQVKSASITNQDMTYNPYNVPTNQLAQPSNIDMYSPEVIAKFQNYLPQVYKPGTFSYNPAEDQGLAVAQKVAMNKVAQDMVARGRLYSSLTDTQQQQKAQELIPQYQQIAYQQFMGQEGLNRQSYQDEYNRMADILGLAEKQFTKTAELTGKTPGGQYTLKGLKDLADIAKTGASVNTEKAQTIKELASAQENIMQAQGQELKNLGFTYDNAGKLYDIQGKQINNQADLDKAIGLQFERVMPGAPQTPQNMQSYQSFSKLNQNPAYADAFKQISQNAQNVDIAGLINDAVASGDTELANALNYLRYQKVFGDPEMLLKYGTNFGLSDLETAKKAKDVAYKQTQIIGQQLENQIKDSELYVQKETEMAQIITKIAKSEEAVSDAEKAKIEALYAEPIKKQQIANMVLDYNKGLQDMQFAANREARAVEDQRMQKAKFDVEIGNLTKEQLDKEIGPQLRKTVDEIYKGAKESATASVTNKNSINFGKSVDKDAGSSDVYDALANAGVSKVAIMKDMLDRGYSKDAIIAASNKYNVSNEQDMMESGNKSLRNPNLGQKAPEEPQPVKIGAQFETGKNLLGTRLSEQLRKWTNPTKSAKELSDRIKSAAEQYNK